MARTLRLARSKKDTATSDQSDVTSRLIYVLLFLGDLSAKLQPLERQQSAEISVVVFKC